MKVIGIRVLVIGWKSLKLKNIMIYCKGFSWYYLNVMYIMILYVFFYDFELNLI